MTTAPPSDASPAAPTGPAAPSEAELKSELDAFREDFARLRAEVGRVIVGHANIVDGTLTALIAGGHVLLEGVPGLGKTLLVNTLASALSVTFGRVQFTPDLMPADLVGTNVVTEDEHGHKRFEFQRGPIFAHVLLADEVNRATPKTQSALLEAMQEKSVTVGGHTHKLPAPFLVLATQNPLEMEGTYPLPEAQLDRFFVKLLVEFPTAEDLGEILNRTTAIDVPAARPVLDGDRVLAMRDLARQVPIADEVRDRAVAMTLATHPEHPSAPEAVKKYVRFGSSPRGAQALVLAAKVKAILDGRFHVSKDDLHDAAPAVLRHRLILGFEGQAEGVRADDVIADVVKAR
ncbi:AAA family ATPase [Alienimonas sp. DA493]|uniref:AAA family ATPase n=1 Tax=Alienimonas sp. DA493 TaxID=3373605 RepID=UPI00375413BC